MKCSKRFEGMPAFGVPVLSLLFLVESFLFQIYGVKPCIFFRGVRIRVMEKLAKYQGEEYNSWTDFRKECSKSSHDPLDVIANLTVKIGDASGRRVRVEMEDMHLFPVNG